MAFILEEILSCYTSEVRVEKPTDLSRGKHPGTDRQTDRHTHPEPPADPDSAKVEELLDYYSDLQAEIAQELE